MTQIRDDMIALVAEALDVPASRVDPDLPVEDLGLFEDEWREVFVRIAERNGRNVGELLATMPIYSIARSDAVMSGLQDLAAVSTAARDRLAGYTTQVNLDTINSLAATIETGHYVPSGEMSDPVHMPRSRLHVGLKYGLLATAAAILPRFFAERRSCAPLCGGSFNHGALDPIIPQLVGAVLFLVIVGVLLGPALLDPILTRRAKRKRRDKYSGI